MRLIVEMKIKKIKGFSKTYSRIIIFDDYTKCLDGGDYQQECDKYIIRSLNHKRKLHRVLKSTLLSFDNKRCYASNIKSERWD